MSRIAPAALCFLLLPVAAHAAVIINEVAWMGTDSSANDEWIELYNDGSSSVDLAGWQLAAIDGAPSIALDGRIAPQSYYLLERTDDATVSSVAADLIYTGALGNAGEVLELTDADGRVLDRVDGADAWALGGDNETKATLSRSDGGWITGEPTPGRANGAALVPAEDADDAGRDKTAESSEAADGGRSSTNIITGTAPQKREPRERPIPKPRLTVTAGDDRRASVGQSVSFEAVAYADDGDRLPASYMWNFGDGTTAEGRRVEHVYAYDGHYVVQVTAETTLFREPLVARDRLTVFVEPATIEITEATATYLELANREAREVDLSGWQLAYGGEVFTMPEGSILLPEATVKLSHTTTGFSVDEPDRLALFYPSSMLASRFGTNTGEAREDDRVARAAPEPATPAEARAAAGADRVEPVPASLRATPAVAAQEPTPSAPPPQRDTTEPAHAQLAAVTEATAPQEATSSMPAEPRQPEDSSLMIWLLALGGVLGIGAAATLLLGRSAEESADAQSEIQREAARYDLIDESENAAVETDAEERRTPFPGGF